MAFENIFLEGLPDYEGGVITEATKVGPGLRDDRKPEKLEPIFNVGEEYTEDEFKEKLKNNRGHWEVSKIGLSGRHYLGRRWVRVRWNEGKITEVEYLDPEPTEKEDKASWIRVVKETSAEEFNAYVKKLVDLGFEIIYENQIENNLFRELVKGEKHVYAYYMANTKTARIVDDKTSIKLPDFGYEYEAKEGEKTEIYQYGLRYGHMQNGLSCDCGMLYIVKLADNSLFIVDGGEYEQSTDQVIEHVMDLFHKITKTKKGEKIRIAAYYVTHAHDDHMDLFSKLIKVYHEELQLERVVYNFPSDWHYHLMPQTYIMIDRILKYYPDVKYLQAHTGQKFSLANTEFEVLQTLEDGLFEPGMRCAENRFGGFNDTSLVLRLHFDGKKFDFLGDIDDDAEQVILSHYSKEYLKTDMVQVAHHLINNLQYLYDVLQPTIALIPQHSNDRTRENHPAIKPIRRHVKEEDIYFVHDGTDGFRVENGEIVHFFHTDMVGGEYDGSDT